MVTQLIPMAPGTPFEAERHEPIDEVQAGTRALPLTRQSLVTSGAEATFMNETTRRATLANPPIQYLLAVDFGDGTVSLMLPMLVDSSGAPRSYLLETPGHLEGASLYGVHLEGAILNRAHLEKARLTEAYLEGAEGLTQEQLEQADRRRDY